MTTDVVALETRLLLPLRRAAEDAITRLGMTLDPDRDLPEAEPSGGDAADETAAAGPESPRHMAGGTGHAGSRAMLNVSSGPRVTQDVRSQASRPVPARRDDANASIRVPARTSWDDDGAAASVPGGTVQTAVAGAGVRLSSPGEPRAAIEAPAAGPQMEGEKPRFAEGPIAPVAHPPGTPLFSPAPEIQPTPSASPPAARGPGRGIAADLPSSPVQTGSGSSGEAPSQSSSQSSSGLPVRAAQDDPAARGLMMAADWPPASGAPGKAAPPEAPFGTPATVRALADMPGLIDRVAARPGETSPAAPPEEPFAGLIPVRTVVGTPGRVPPAAAVPGEPPYPATASATPAHPALGEVARALQPVLSRAADLGEAAWDDDVPRAVPPSVSNTFNVTVAMAGNSSPVDREALQDALTDLLRDAARRQGLDL